MYALVLYTNANKNASRLVASPVDLAMRHSMMCGEVSTPVHAKASGQREFWYLEWGTCRLGHTHSGLQAQEDKVNVSPTQPHSTS